MEKVPLRITRNSYCVGGPNLTDSGDCFIYMVNVGGPLILVDAGLGRSIDQIITNIGHLKCKPENVSLLVLTHEHIDHIGGAAGIRKRLGCQVAAHQIAVPVITKGDSEVSAAKYYGVSLTPCPVDMSFVGDAGLVPIGNSALHYVHTPGHTPGSIILYFDDGDRRVLFGQDLHGPFNAEWGSDIEQWRTSMQLVLALEADILCEGHYGVYRGKSAVRQFIFGLLEQHK
jgi:glyoxylase-like metal-dependent hydrolase (beta-lactamase superfamily II)